MIGNMVAVARHELRRIFTDPGVTPVMLISVIIYFFLYPQPYLTEIPRNLPIVVVDMDNSAKSRQLTRWLDISEGVAVVARFETLELAKQAFFARQNYGIVLIPLHFEKMLSSGKPSPVIMYADGSYFLPYNQLATTIQGVAREMATELALERGSSQYLAQRLLSPFQLTLMPLFNPQGGYATYIFPMAFILIMQQTLLMGVGLLGAGGSLTELDRRVYSSFTPWPATLILVLGRVLGYLLLYSLVFLLYTLVMPYFYDLPRLGSLRVLGIVGLSYLLAICCLGMCIAQAMPNRHSVLLLLFPSGVLILFISGNPWPAEAIPPLVRYIGYFLPTTFGIKAIVSVNQLGADLGQVKRELIALWTMIFVYGSMAVVLYHFRLRSR